ncbi:MAG TPA: DUF502 domain-containing protein [Pirellulaceae bacterium]|nr:DUF502 domain-containing protein [Pirellulaceae bacterium]
MRGLRRHFVRCFIAGIVALLPIAGLTLTIVYFEGLIAGSWLKSQGFYFFGLGLLILVILVYLVGLIVSTVVGRWLWRRVDGLLDQLPVLGNLYQTLKQLLGYGAGPNALFRRAVWIATEDVDVWELGLVTREQCPEAEGRITVFVPHAPNPTTGRLVLVETHRVRTCALTVGQAMQTLVSIGAISDPSPAGEQQAVD